MPTTSWRNEGPAGGVGSTGRTSDMAKSKYAKMVDGIQAALRPLMKTRGFKVRGRTFNRRTDDELTQVVNLQMGPSDPPGTTYFRGLRKNLHGLFTVNLGVYVPEVSRIHGRGEVRSWVQDYHCCVRARLGEAADKTRDVWWRARADGAVADEVGRLLEAEGFPFLDRFSTRDKILAEWRDRSQNMGASAPPRIVMAIILAERGQREQARALLARQAIETRNPGHPDYVRKLASKLAVGSLDC